MSPTGSTAALRLEALKGPFSFQGDATVDGPRLRPAPVDGKARRGRRDHAVAVGCRSRPQFHARRQRCPFRRARRRSSPAISAIAGRLPRAAEGEAGLISDAAIWCSKGRSRRLPIAFCYRTYTLLPDENRGATRLTGAAELKSARAWRSIAVVSGGVVALPPRDATKELSDPPYELVRLLAETPLPVIPGIPGTVGLDITELNLRGVSLRIPGSMLRPTPRHRPHWSRSVPARRADFELKTLQERRTAHAGER